MKHEDKVKRSREPRESLNETSRPIETEKKIKELNKIIDSESAKPDSERDFDLIDECADLINLLSGTDISVNDNDIDVFAERLLSISEERNENRAEGKGLGKTMKIVLVAAVFMAITAVGVIASSPLGSSFFERFNVSLKEVIELSENEKIEIRSGVDIEVERGKPSRRYDSIEKAIEAEKLDIAYPEKMINDCKAISISFIERSDEKVFAMMFEPGAKLVQYVVEFGIDRHFEGENITEEEVNGTVFYCFSDEDGYWAQFVLGEDTYTILCSDKNAIDEAVKQIKE